MTVILVVDQHCIYRSGLRDVLERWIENARVVDAAALDDLDERGCFDLILIDSESVTQHSRRLLNEVHALNPCTRFAMMSSSNTRADVFNCLLAGFHGFLYKPQSDDELLGAINDLLSGRIYVPRWLADADNNGPELPHSETIAARRVRLTTRQGEILPLLAEGRSNKEIASLLSIAEGTTKIHTAALLRALGARNRTEAAFMAAKLIRARG
jgi:DNA-binding NarL/FixJ family response regulator